VAPAKIFVHFAAKPHPINELFYTSIITHLIFHYLEIIYIISLGSMPSNVPAVCDGFLRPIKKLRSSFRAQKNVGGVWRGKERSGMT
jgi:hypothetical protein